MATVDSLQVAQIGSKSPYQLDIPQVTKACKSLLRNVVEEKTRKDAQPSKPNLLATPEDASSEDADAEHDDIPLWLIMTTKQHIVDQKRLKPGKIPLPHPIHTSPSSTICLITADPQRLYKDVISSPGFPASFRSRITRVIDLSKLKTRYKAFEARRQLVAEHDIFLADDRIIVYLPQFLGKIFYKGGSKRPVPVSIAGPAKRDEQGKRVKRLRAPGTRRQPDDETNPKTAPSPEALSKEIGRALDSAMVHLSPGTSTAVKVARAGFTADMCAENVAAVVHGLTERFITKGWRNVRAIHVKSPESIAFPIWMADELWVDEENVLEEKKVFGKKGKSKTSANSALVMSTKDSVDQADRLRKRKAESARDIPAEAKHIKKKRKAEVDQRLAAETALRKEMLKNQKAGVLASVAKA